MDEQGNTSGQDLDRRVLLLDNTGAFVAGFREGLYSSTPLCYLRLGRPELELEPYLEHNPNYSYGRAVGTAAGLVADAFALIGALSIFDVLLTYM